jgi:hypothetical protein
MKLFSLYADAVNTLKPQLLKGLDPNLPELEGQPIEPGEYGQPSQSARSGVQDTPLKPRHRKYFNANTNQPATDKIGYPDQGWSDIRKYTPSNRWIRPYLLNIQH